MQAALLLTCLVGAAVCLPIDVVDQKPNIPLVIADYSSVAKPAESGSAAAEPQKIDEAKKEAAVLQPVQLQPGVPEAPVLPAAPVSAAAPAVPLQQEEVKSDPKPALVQENPAPALPAEVIASPAIVPIPLAEKPKEDAKKEDKEVAPLPSTISEQKAEAPAKLSDEAKPILEALPEKKKEEIKEELPAQKPEALPAPAVPSEIKKEEVKEEPAKEQPQQSLPQQPAEEAVPAKSENIQPLVIPQEGPAVVVSPALQQSKPVEQQQAVLPVQPLPIVAGSLSEETKAEKKPEELSNEMKEELLKKPEEGVKAESEKRARREAAKGSKDGEKKPTDIKKEDAKKPKL